MTEDPDMPDPAPGGGWDVFMSYRVEDEPVARALRGQLRRLRPGLKIWAEKSAFGIGNGFNQEMDEALSRSARVILVWTPPRLADPSGLETEARRALTLQRPVLNVSAGLGKRALPSPYARFGNHEIPAVAQLAGRGAGWGPAQRPEVHDLDRQVEPVARWIDQSTPGDPQMADWLISRFAGAAGWAGRAPFEAVTEALARGDRASAIEILLNAGYDASRIDQIISPMRLRLADTRHARPPWGAWRLEPRPQPEDPRPATGWIWAVSGFLACGLMALSLWLMASVMSAGERAQPAQPVEAARLPACKWNDAREAVSLPCRLTRPLPGSPTEPDAPAGGAPPPAPKTGEGSQARADTATAPAPKPCELSPQGRVVNTPCLLEEADSPTPPASGEALVAEAGETPQTDTEKPEP
ncbi:MAG: TIR domain-containing protein, partial [Alphaproteobacteria bacterium]|nr:TIR domain-containing protein [Alphaproteobacteria bacterium]